MTKKRVLIDSDPATGVPNRDVDDGLAFLVLLASPDIQVEGITINFGNVGADAGFDVAKNLLNLVHANVPVYKGAKTKAELGKKNEAVDFLIETVKANPGEISLLTLGPLTNVATAMKLDSSFAPNLRELVMMGGSIHFKPFSFFGEFNLHQDGEAASLVLSAPIPKTLITMDVCSQAVFRREHLQMLENHDSDVARHLVKTVAPWLELNRRVFRHAQGFFPWDVEAAAYLIDKALFDENPCSLSIQKTGLRSGRIREFSPVDRQTVVGSVPVNIPTKLDSERFMAMFLDGLLKF
jgi:purine nucleosidase